MPGLQPAVGRLASALVAVLGPELTLGSPAYCSCRALIREMQAGPVAPSDATFVIRLPEVRKAYGLFL